jgi:hypothetical protein
MTLVAVAPNKFSKGFDGSGRQPALSFEVLELHDALTRAYPTDAHLVAYVVEGATRQPRINKAGLAHFPGKVSVGAFFCDVDNPQHSHWNRDLLHAALAQYDSLPVLQTTGVYHTEHGRRIVQPIEQPIPASQVEPYLRRWLLQLEKAGLPVDWACRDWTRHFRLPNVRRHGYPYRAPYMCLDRMRPIDLEPIAAVDDLPAARSPAVPRPVPQIEWTKDVPEVWRGCVEPIAEAVRRVTAEWHQLFLALAGALLTRRVPHEHVPAICRAISAATKADTRTEDREMSARTTVQRHLAGLPTTGYGTLAATWPVVANALDQALARGTEAHLRALASSTAAPAPRTLAETTAALEEAIRRAPDGLTLISAECGLGKTQAAVRVATERAAKPYSTPHAKGARAPPQSKTAISVDKNALALQITNGLRSQSVAVRRAFGPLSLKNADGRPVCRYHDNARPLVEGGQAMQWEFCQGRDIEPCPYRNECPAKDGVEGPEDARITVGPHALLNALDAAAGSTGLLVIDEPPPLLETTAVSLADLDLALQRLPDFDDRYEAAMRPALRALRVWLAERGPLDAVTTLGDAIRSCHDVVDPDELDQACVATSTNGDAVDCVAAAHDPARSSRPPPLRAVSVREAQRSVEAAIELGTASKVLGATYRAVKSTIPVAVRIEERAVLGRLLLMTFARDQLARALQREGAVVVTDANADLHVPVMAKVVGYAPPLHRFAAVDGAPISRTLLRCTSATRKGWLKGGMLVLDGSLLTALREALAWAQEDPAARKMGLITMRVVEFAIAGALRPNDRAIDAAWKDLGQRAKTLAQARDKLGPLLRAWPGEIRLAHYGAVRGLNDMADVDCLITLGDPWPNLGEVRNEVSFLALDEVWEERLEARCRAELEQAHGRLRTIHRARPGRALHVGNVLPGGSGWASASVEFRKLEGGRPSRGPALPAADVKALVDAAGGPSAAAKQTGCSRRLVQLYQQGARRIPAELEARLRELVCRADARRTNLTEGCDQNA